MLWAALCITANSGCQCPLWVKSRHRRCPRNVRFTPQEQTFVAATGMSALCQKWTFRQFCWKRSKPSRKKPQMKVSF